MWHTIQFYICSILAIAFLSAVVALALIPLTEWNSKQWERGKKFLVLFFNRNILLDYKISVRFLMFQYFDNGALTVQRTSYSTVKNQ